MVLAMSDAADAVQVVNLADTYKPTADGIRFHACPKTFVGLGGEKGGGKTWAALAELLSLCMEFPGNRVMVFRQKLETLQTTTLNTFWRVCPPSLIAEHVASAKVVRLVNGSEILYRGLSGNVLSSEPAIQHYLDDLKSLELGAFYINEASQTRKEFWDTLKQTLRWVPSGVDPGKMFWRGLADSNPEPGWFHKTFVREIPGDHAFVHFRAANNAENLAPGYYDRFSDMPESWRKRYVEGRWEFNQEGDCWVYPYDLVVEAMQRELSPAGEAKEYGLDPAGQGADEAVLVLLDPPVFRLWAWAKTTGPQLRDNVLRVMSEHGRALLKYDAGGLGAPNGEFIREAGVKVKPVSTKRTTFKPERFADYRSEMFWALRDRMESKRAVLPDDDRLREQMVALRWSPDSNGRIKVEDKDVYKKRMGMSPDRMEAVVYANWKEPVGQWRQGTY
jgi:hypothetical protein